MSKMKHPLAAFAHSCVLAAFALLVVVLWHDCASATTYYVRTDGNDSNSGTGSTAGSAWATVNNAANSSISAGDIIYVKAGTYEEKLDVKVQGNSSNPIQFIADTSGSVAGWEPGPVTIDASDDGNAIKIDNQDYLEFIGFNIEGKPGDSVLILNNATGLAFRKCELFEGGHGVYVVNATVSIVNCLIRDNENDGIHIVSGTLTVLNTTIANNVNGLEMDAGVVTVTNSIVYNNSSDGLDVNGGSMTHTYNLVYGSGSNDWEGTSASTGEISVDPLFVSVTDYRVTLLSPARNVGTDLTGTVDDDIEGRARPYDGAYDMGCYEEGPLAHWKNDETSGSTAFDSSGFSHDGTHSGSPTWSTSGIRDGSLDFETSDGVDRVDAGNFDVVGTQLTLIAWVRQEDPLNDGRIIMKSSSNSGSDQSWGMAIDENGELDFRVTAGSTYQRLQAPGVISPNTWYHVAGTYDGTTMRLYLDGQLIASSTHSAGGAIVSNSAHTVTLGDSPIGSRPFDGLIDDARIYDRTLSVDEIIELYGGPIGHWKLDETSGTTAVDSSPHTNNGTYTNGPTLGITGAYPGNIATSVEFDGNDDYIEISHIEEMLAENGSIAFWFNASDLSGRQELFSKDSSGFDTGGHLTVYLNGTQLAVRLQSTTESHTVNYSTIATGVWYHVGFTWGANGMRLYLNGEEVDNKTSYTGGLGTSSGGTGNFEPIAIGANTYGSGDLVITPLQNYFYGMIDDVRFYNRALIAIEVSELYGLTGHWKMDEGSGSTAADSTAFANDATLNGATWTSDCTGNNGLEFDGLNDTTATNASFDPPETGTVAMWLRSAGNPGARSRPFGVGGDWEMRQETDGTLSFDLGGEGPPKFITTEGLSFEDRWYHVVAHFDATDDSFEVYINGELVNSGTNGYDMTKQIANTLTFGTRTGNTEYWEGGMRDFRIYNRWLSGSEISDLSGLVAYWKLDESSGTVAADSSPNGNDGTYTGGVTLFQTGQVDQAVEFDGSDDYVGVPDDPTLQMDDVFSLSCWIRPDSSSNIDQMILNKEGEYEIAISPSDELKWAITNSDPGWSWHSTGHIVAIGKWTHVALIYDNGTVTTYANGVLVDAYNGSGTVGDQYTSLNELRLGGRSNNPTGKYFDGRLDDVRVFKRVLCSEEVFGQYRGGRPAGVRILKWVEVR